MVPVEEVIEVLMMAVVVVLGEGEWKSLVVLMGGAVAEVSVMVVVVIVVAMAMVKALVDDGCGRGCGGGSGGDGGGGGGDSVEDMGDGGRW